MRIVSYAEMKTLPVGTIFYRMGARGGCVDALDGPYRKDAVSEHDIFYCEIGPRYNDAGYCKRLPRHHFAIDNGGTREGLFEEDAKYLVLDARDVDYLIRGIQGLLKNDEQSVVEVPYGTLG